MDIKEKVLNNRKNGMAMMLLFIIFYAAAAGIMLVSAITELIPLMLLAIIWISIGWIPFLGLKVLKPQEALVLTLFGKYVGTLKDAGFYWVNPFCSSVNPTVPCEISCVFILTMWHRMSIRPVTALPMKAACVVPAKLLQDASAMRSRRK